MLEALALPLGQAAVRAAGLLMYLLRLAHRQAWMAAVAGEAGPHLRYTGTAPTVRRAGREATVVAVAAGKQAA
jgi:hypothetical protein